MKPGNSFRTASSFDFGEQLALLIEAVEDYAIFALSPEGEIRSWNRGAGRIMGYEAEEVVGRHFSIFYGPEDLERKKPQKELEIAAREGKVEDEGWRVRKDGTRFWANTIITVLRDESGTPRGFAKITRDLTRRREAEQRVRQSEETFRLLVASVKDYAIFFLDPKGNVATWNAGAEAIKGYKPHEIIGKHFSTFYSEEDKLSRKPERELEIAITEGSVEDEGWRIRKDGSRFWANVIITAVRDEQGKLRGFAKVTRDLTDRKRAEEVQRALMKQREARLLAEEEKRHAEAAFHAAQEANRAKDEFLMTLSHELRTPMTAIMGWSRLLPTLSPNDPVVPEALASIARSADLQAQLIDDVLDVSRIVSGKLRLNLVNADVVGVLNAAIDSVRPSAAAKHTTIVSSFGDDLGQITADPTRLQQIFWNLLSNAVKFTPKAGRVEITARRTGSQLQVCVADTGKGIDPSFLPHIFEPFRQAETPETRVHGGLGLGLSIVRYLTEAHGGTVSAESEGEGKGSKFTINLPISAVAAQDSEIRPSSRYAEIAHIKSDRLAGVKILLVDDDDDARNLVRTTLRQAGASVTAVGSAAAASEELQREKPDIVLTDVAMPHVDGYSLSRSIRARSDLGAVKLVALSAFPEGDAGNRAEFDAYLTKPIDPFKLIEALAAIVGR